jgi:hypothetical protein
MWKRTEKERAVRIVSKQIRISISVVAATVTAFFWWAGEDSANAAEVVPTEIQQPGTQPGEVGNLETPGKCDNCHGNSSKGVELAHEWRGSMMAHASRDPIF